MQYRGLGYSNIRLPDDNNTYLYKYDVRANTFPEEVFIHEFLHTLERNAEEYGYYRPVLHNYEQYNYHPEALVNLKKWYQDYMNKEIKTQAGYVGLPTQVYTIKPAKTTDFEYSRELDDLREPENIIEDLSFAFNRIRKMFLGSENE